MPGNVCLPSEPIIQGQTLTLVEKVLEKILHAKNDDNEKIGYFCLKDKEELKSLFLCEEVGTVRTKP